jgi:hypothetical protein
MQNTIIQDILKRIGRNYSAEELFWFLENAEELCRQGTITREEELQCMGDIADSNLIGKRSSENERSIEAILSEILPPDVVRHLSPFETTPTLAEALLNATLCRDLWGISLTELSVDDLDRYYKEITLVGKLLRNPLTPPDALMEICDCAFNSRGGDSRSITRVIDHPNCSEYVLRRIYNISKECTYEVRNHLEDKILNSPKCPTALSDEIANNRLTSEEIAREPRELEGARQSQRWLSNLQERSQGPRGRGM